MKTTLITLFDVEYEVCSTGEVKNKETNATPPILTYADGKPRTIVLFDNEAVMNVDLGLFTLYAFNRFFLPLELWEDVEVGFLDDDRENYRVDNLYVRYSNGPIEFELLDGFYYVPGLELNAINKKGALYRIPQSDVLFPIQERNEKFVEMIYPHYRININTNIVLTRDVHRLLATTFLNPPEKYPLLHVNHKNGNKQDYRLGNLEWLTVRDNNLHAFIEDLRTDNKRIQIKDIETGEVKTYFSLGEAARQMGSTAGALSAVVHGMTRIYLKRYLVKELTDSRSWEELESLIPNNTIIPVKARNVLTGEIVAFRSVKEAAKKIGVFSNSILKQINSTKVPRLIMNGFEVKRENDSSLWKEFDEYEIEVFKRGLPNNTPVYIVECLETGKEEVFYGWRSVSELTGAVKRTIIQVSKIGGTIGRKYKVTKVK